MNHPTHSYQDPLQAEEELFSEILDTFHGEHDFNSFQHTAYLIPSSPDSTAKRLASVALQRVRALPIDVDSLPLVEKTMKVSRIVFGIGFEMQKVFLSGWIMGTLVDILNEILCVNANDAVPLREDQSTNGVPWVIEALRRKLILVLLKATDKLKAPSDVLDIYTSLETKYIEKLIGTILPKFMVFSSVIDVASIVFNRSEVALIKRAKESGPLKDKWNALFDLIVSRSAVQGMVSVRHQYMKVRCNNVECNVQALRKTMKRCGRCHNDIYCSAVCQRKAWNDGKHRSECFLLEDHDNLVSWGPHDIAFFGFLIREIISADMLRIGTLARELYPSLPTEKLGLDVDFSGVPPRVEIFNIEDTEEERVEDALRPLVVVPRKINCLSTIELNGDDYLLQNAYYVTFDLFWQLLDALALPHRLDAAESGRLVEAAETASKRVRDLIRKVAEDFQSFLEDGKRSKWSNQTAKRVILEAADYQRNVSEIPLV